MQSSVVLTRNPSGCLLEPVEQNGMQYAIVATPQSIAFHISVCKLINSVLGHLNNICIKHYDNISAQRKDSVFYLPHRKFAYGLENQTIEFCIQLDSVVCMLCNISTLN